MDLWLLVQIGIVIFFTLVPIAVVMFLLWIKRVVDENRELAKKELELWSGDTDEYGRCEACSEPIRKGFLYCPVCHKKLGNKCPGCHRFLKIKWTKCPYCGEEYGAAAVEAGQQKQLAMKLDSAATQHPSSAQ